MFMKILIYFFVVRIHFHKKDENSWYIVKLYKKFTIKLKYLLTFKNLNSIRSTVSTLSEVESSINRAVSLYIGIGCVSLFCNFVFYSCFATSSERQIKKLRYKNSLVIRFLILIKQNKIF